MTISKPRIIFTCGREPEYVRNRQLLSVLRKNYDLIEITDSRKGSLTTRLVRLLPRLLKALTQPHDLVCLGFYAHLLVPIVKKMTSAPILFDAFVSTYDTLCLDRGIIAPSSLAGRFIFYLDQIACRLADQILLDTHTHSQFFQNTFNIPDSKLNTLYLGADEAIFYPRPIVDKFDELIVFSYSTYLPLHGTEVIVKAASQCQDYPIEFRLIGDSGPQYFETRCLANEMQLTNFHILPSVPFNRLPGEIAGTSVCLGGHFGATPKARRVIAGKTYQFMAMGKPVIAGDNPANRELLDHEITAYFCPMDDPLELAEAVKSLCRQPNLLRRLGEDGYNLFIESLRWNVLGKDLLKIVDNMLQE